MTSQNILPVKLSTIDGELRISSTLIAESIGTTHKATNNLIRKHQERFDLYGKVPFKKAPSASGQMQNAAYLNEDQAMFLMTLSRNTEIVVEFKQRLVSAFSKLRRKQAIIDENHAKAEWHMDRDLGKISRYTETLQTKDYVAHAIRQGSTGYGRDPNRAYINITKLVNKNLGIIDRDALSMPELQDLKLVEGVVAKVLAKGIAQDDHYKDIYKMVRQEVESLAKLINQGD